MFIPEEKWKDVLIVVYYAVFILIISMLSCESKADVISIDIDEIVKQEEQDSRC